MNQYLQQAISDDQKAQNRESVEENYQRAIELEPQNATAFAYYICYLSTTGQTAKMKAIWEIAKNLKCSPEELHFPVARTLLHWGELDTAQEVLKAVPKKLHDRTCEALVRCLLYLKSAEFLPAMLMEPDRWYNKSVQDAWKEYDPR